MCELQASEWGPADADWPFVGRHRELEAIESELARAGAAGVLITGPPGVGKTRLARECLPAATQQGFAVAHVAGSGAAASVPLGAFAPFLDERDRRSSSAPDADQGYLPLLLAARRGLETYADRKRLLIFADNAHSLDDLSAALVQQLVGAGEACAVVTLRSGEDGPDAISALWTAGHVLRVDLGPLTEREMETLLCRCLHGDVGGPTTRQLWRLTGGHPLSVREIVASARHEGALEERDGVWRLLRDPSPSSRLVDLIEPRLCALEPSARFAFEIVAVAGAIGLSELQKLTAAGAVASLDDNGLVHSARDGRRTIISPAHPLEAAVARKAMSALHSRKVHASLAASLEASGRRRDGDTVRLALWRLEADGTADAQLLLEAARGAASAYDFGLARRLARAAARADRRPETSLLLGQMLKEFGDFEHTEELLADAQSASECPSLRTEIGTVRMTNLFWGLQRLEDALVLGRSLEAEVHTRLRPELRARRAYLLFSSGDVDGAIAEVADADGLPDVSGFEARVRSYVTMVLTPALAHAGRTDAALAASETGLQAHIELEPSAPGAVHPAAHLVNRVMALTEAGRLGEAGELAEFLYRGAVEVHMPLGVVVTSLSISRVAIRTGQLHDAERRAREAAAICGDLGHESFLRWSLTLAALASALAGKAPEANRDIDRARAISSVAGLLDTELVRAQAWSAASAGHVGGACDLLLEAADAAAASGRRAFEAAALHDVVRLGRAADVAQRLAVLADAADGDLPRLRAEHAAAAAARDVSALERVAGGFETIGALLLAAEVSAQAALRAGALGESRTGVRLERQAVSLAARCQGAATWPLTQLAGPANLSAREREVAALVAGGLTTKAVADHLCVSPRTVDNHLQHVFAKLGIKGRRDVAAALADAGTGRMRGLPTRGSTGE